MRADPETREPADLLPHERGATRTFFNRTALAFPLIERVILPEYREALAHLGLQPGHTVLDLGTGTGSLARAFHERGHRVTGYDFSERLLARARRLCPQVTFENRDVTELDDVGAGSFDVVAMGYVLHGMSPALRRRTLRTASRLAARRIVIIDYGRRGGWFTRLIERIEGPHYFEYIQHPLRETLHAEGIGIIERSRTRTGGRCWLCRPARRR